MTEILRPTTQPTGIWDTSSVSLINEVVTQPTAPSTAGGTYEIADPLDDFEENVYGGFDHATAASVTELYDIVKSVKVWIYARDNGGFDTDIDVRIKVDGVWETAQNIDYSTGWAWFSVTFNGAWDAADVDGIELGIQVQSNPDYNQAALYLEIDGNSKGAGQVTSLGVMGTPFWPYTFVPLPPSTGIVKTLIQLHWEEEHRYTGF